MAVVRKVSKRGFSAYGELNRSREFGAVLVETSIVSMLLLVIASGILEYTSVFSTSVDSTYAIRNAARAGAMTSATGPPDDARILASLVQKAGSKRTNIEQAVIYLASSPSAGPPSGCLAGVTSAADKCNVYSAAEIANPGSVVTKTGWPTASRVPGVDYIGVWARATRSPLFGLVSSPVQFNDSFTLRMAPVPPVSGANGWKLDIIGPEQAGGADANCWDTRGCASIGTGGGGFGSAGGSGGGSSG